MGCIGRKPWPDPDGILMRWVVPAEKDAATETLEKRPWNAACLVRGAMDVAIWWSDPGLFVRWQVIDLCAG